MNEGRRIILDQLRQGLEATDRQLMDLLVRRARQVEAIWAWKRHKGLPIYDPAREERLRLLWMEYGRRTGLDPAPLAHLFYALLEVTGPASKAGDFVRPHPPALPPGRDPSTCPPGSSDQQEDQQQEPARPGRRNGQCRAGPGVAHIRRARSAGG